MGESHSVREFLELAFNYAGIEIEWKGEGLDQVGVIKSLSSRVQAQSSLKTGDKLISIDPRYFRPAEVDYLLADFTKAKERLGWMPKVTFNELVKIMVDADFETLGIESPDEGKNILMDKNITWTKNIITDGYI